LQVVFGAAAAAFSRGQDAGFGQQLDVPQGGIEGASGQFCLARGGQLAIGAVEERVDDEPRSVVDRAIYAENPRAYHRRRCGD